MKKLIVLLVAVVLLFAVALTYFGIKDKAGEPAATAQPEASAAVETAEPTPTPDPVLGIDYEALYATHDPDEVIAVVEGEDVTWQDYFCWVYYSGSTVENYMIQMSYYGQSVSWDDIAIADENLSYADYVDYAALSNVKQIICIEHMAEELGTQLSDEEIAEIDEKLKSDIISTCGETGTEEDFAAYLGETYMTLKTYNRMNRLNYLYQNNFDMLYGKDGADVSDEDALKYLEDNAYFHENHILLATVDTSTGEALDEATAAEKKAKAEEIAAELAAITDPEELIARFTELKAELCEDPGKTAYPDGSMFNPESYVKEFSDAFALLEDNQVSGVVESANYGYFIILRLPLDPDATIEFSDAGTALTARSKFANDAFNNYNTDRFDAAVIEYAPDYVVFNLKDYLVAAVG